MIEAHLSMHSFYGLRAPPPKSPAQPAKSHRTKAHSLRLIQRGANHHVQDRSSRRAQRHTLGCHTWHRCLCGAARRRLRAHRIIPWAHTPEQNHDQALIWHDLASPTRQPDASPDSHSLFHVQQPILGPLRVSTPSAMVVQRRVSHEDHMAWSLPFRHASVWATR